MFMRMPLRRPAHPGRVAIVVGGLLLAGNLALYGLLEQDTGTPSDDRPAAIEQLFPVEEAQILPQDTIGADLRDDLQGVLYIDNVRIPEDQYNGNRNIREVLWRPGENKQWRETPEGRRTATIEFWPIERTYEEALQAGEVASYSWEFTVA